MWNTVIVAARPACVCLLLALFSGRPSPGQQVTGQQPPAQAPQTGGQQAPPSTPAPPPSPIDQYYTGHGFSITLYGWGTTGHPTMGTGHGNTNSVPSDVDNLGKSQPAAGASVSIPISKLDSIRVSYFRMKGSGNTVTPVEINVFGNDFSAGDALSNSYTLQNVKISLDYMSWPFPVQGRKFRLKTLWEVQYTTISSIVNAPLGNVSTGTTGPVYATGSDSLIYPTFGLGFDYLASANFRVEARASGFGIPHHGTIWDAEFSAHYRFGKFEIEGGGKAFHFKTSPQGTEYVHATFPGVFAGLRFYPKNGR